MRYRPAPALEVGAQVTAQLPVTGDRAPGGMDTVQGRVGAGLLQGHQVPGARAVGPAVTVRTAPGDWLASVQSIDIAEPGHEQPLAIPTRTLPVRGRSWS